MGEEKEITEAVAKLLSGRRRQEIKAPELRPAAVLVPLFSKEGRLFLLMGLRSQELEHHRGQIAFPGGLLEPADAGPAECALREAEEEIGLRREDVQVLGLADDERTVTGFRITPVVGFVPHPYPFRLNRSEMLELLQVPWSLFGDRACHRREQIEYAGEKHEVDFYQFGSYCIWGATARISRRLFELAGAAVAAGEGKTPCSR